MRRNWAFLDQEGQVAGIGVLRLLAALLAADDNQKQVPQLGRRGDLGRDDSSKLKC